MDGADELITDNMTDTDWQLSIHDEQLDMSQPTGHGPRPTATATATATAHGHGPRPRPTSCHWQTCHWQICRCQRCARLETAIQRSQSCLVEWRHEVDGLVRRRDQSRRLSTHSNTVSQTNTSPRFQRSAELELSFYKGFWHAYYYTTKGALQQLTVNRAVS